MNVHTLYLIFTPSIRVLKTVHVTKFGAYLSFLTVATSSPFQVISLYVLTNTFRLLETERCLSTGLT